MKKGILALSMLLSVSYLFGQEESIEAFDADLVNWYNKDIKKDKIMGASVDRVYESFINGKEAKKTVVVAVIDGGVDVNHVDLQGKIWVNEDEIPDNGIDDDKNGYIDDIHGWNFIGNSTGENVDFENIEATRIVKNKKNRDKDYERALNHYKEEVEKREKRVENLEKFFDSYKAAKKDIFEESGVQVNSAADLEKVIPESQQVLYAKNFLQSRYDQGVDEEAIQEAIDYNRMHLDYYLNKDFNPREIVGDNPENMENTTYGNNDVTGPKSSHGTTVAGVIAANRNNDIGINGIAENVKIMAIRSTPKGDERDKDVALAIMYAVDNGADIINMSFGKDFSPQKAFVDSAVRYAEQKGVLLIHAAGNSGDNIDINERFPSDLLLSGVEVTNWLNVGATQSTVDKELAGIFSNYGKVDVDIFAPGVSVISLDSTNTYVNTSGTSIAAPIVTGVCALILSYYPELTPQEMISLLDESAHRLPKRKKVLTPDLENEKRAKIKFIELSKFGGIVNAYNAFEILEMKE